MMHKHPWMRISHLLPTLALSMTVGYSSVSAQTIVPNGVKLSGVVNTTPRPTFYFTLAPELQSAYSILLTWGTGTKKDGIILKREGLSNTWQAYDITKTGPVVTVDAKQDIFSALYDRWSGRISFVRSWNTFDTTGDVPLVKGIPNNFQWEVILPGTKVYTGTFSSDLSLVVAP